MESFNAGHSYVKPLPYINGSQQCKVDPDHRGGQQRRAPGGGAAERTVQPLSARGPVRDGWANRLTRDEETIRQVYKKHAEIFFEEVKDGFQKEAEKLRKHAQKAIAKTSAYDWPQGLRSASPEGVRPAVAGTQADPARLNQDFFVSVSDSIDSLSERSTRQQEQLDNLSQRLAQHGRGPDENLESPAAIVQRVRVLEERLEHGRRKVEADLQALKREDLDCLDLRVGGVGERLGGTVVRCDELDARCRVLQTNLAEEISDRRSGAIRLEASLAASVAQCAEDGQNLRAALMQEVASGVADCKETTGRELQALTQALSDATVSITSMATDAHVLAQDMARDMAPRLARLEAAAVAGGTCESVDKSAVEASRVASFEERLTLVEQNIVRAGGTCESAGAVDKSGVEASRLAAFEERLTLVEQNVVRAGVQLSTREQDVETESV